MQTIKKVYFTIELTIGINIELIDVFEVNSVAVALIIIIANKVISFWEDMHFFRLSLTRLDRPELLRIDYYNKIKCI